MGDLNFINDIPPLGDFNIVIIKSTRYYPNTSRLLGYTVNHYYYSQSLTFS